MKSSNRKHNTSATITRLRRALQHRTRTAAEAIAAYGRTRRELNAALERLHDQETVAVMLHRDYRAAISQVRKLELAAGCSVVPHPVVLH